MKEFQPHELRVIDELKELRVKHIALTKFIDGPEYGKYNSLPDMEKSLLVRQESVMNEYIQILATRIGLFV